MEGLIVVVTGLIIFAVASLLVTLRAEKKEKEKKGHRHDKAPHQHHKVKAA
ncbi:hypothetical protein [Geobacter grbiciae]|uniref:hypothetical protein n=1 Tax=Geobacter grbiciae TaxID=155042 RepID=UPI001FE3F47E|nr:hypothetical protein [Geobacter grbiciae]